MFKRILILATLLVASLALGGLNPTNAQEGECSFNLEWNEWPRFVRSGEEYEWDETIPRVELGGTIGNFRIVDFHSLPNSPSVVHVWEPSSNVTLGYGFGAQWQSSNCDDQETVTHAMEFAEERASLNHPNDSGLVIWMSDNNVVSIIANLHNLEKAEAVEILVDLGWDETQAETAFDEYIERTNP